MTSATRVTAVLGILALCIAAVASWQASNDPRLQETCADTRALYDLDGFGYEVDGATRTGRRLRGTIDGYVRFDDGETPRMPFTLRRTFQLPFWAIRPTKAIPGPKEPDRFERRTLDVDGSDVQIEFAYAMHRSHLRFAAYLFIYDGATVPGAFFVRLREAPLAPFVGVKPLTYVGVASLTDLRHLPEQEERATEVLTAAWRHYVRSCRPGDAGAQAPASSAQSRGTRKSV